MTGKIFIRPVRYKGQIVFGDKSGICGRWSDWQCSTKKEFNRPFYRYDYTRHTETEGVITGISIKSPDKTLEEAQYVYASLRPIVLPEGTERLLSTQREIIVQLLRADISKFRLGERVYLYFHEIADKPDGKPSVIVVYPHIID